jgi:succinyl-CoA synthetase beta subunit
LTGLTEEVANQAVESAGFEFELQSELVPLLLKLWRIYCENDASLVEVNPLALVERDDQTVLQALDAKIILDDSAKFRQKELYNELLEELPKQLFGELPEQPSGLVLESELLEQDLNYVKLQGNVGIIGNGAGLVMSTLDAVEAAGSQFANVHPANFLDIGGGASAEVMFQAMQLVMQDDDVQAVFVNIFGGLTQCDIVATGILEALDHLESSGAQIKPICVRFAGNRATEGLEILRNRAQIAPHRSAYQIEVLEDSELAADFVALLVNQLQLENAVTPEQLGCYPVGGV